jgi:hypothetical protein
LALVSFAASATVRVSVEAEASASVLASHSAFTSGSTSASAVLAREGLAKVAVKATSTKGGDDDLNSIGVDG